ncbi:MAG: carbohydrate porin [Acidobacteriia bacterium]|nr:carbohydrate porin [Terriglobia bacterium]
MTRARDLHRLLRGVRCFLTLCYLLLIIAAADALAQEQPPVPQDPSQASQGTDRAADAENWNLFYQATSIGQYHGTFHSPYSGPFSLQDSVERDVSLTTTLFFGLRLEKNTALYFDPEIAGGRGFSGVNGLANSSNGELPRVASATPKPYLARLYIYHDFSLGPETEPVESDANQLAGVRPVNRYTITVGRFTLTDFFDNNRYSHDPRTQFMGWAVMFNGAWDYPADVRGYDWGWVHELHFRHWSFRYGSGAMPRVANGLRFDRRLFVNRGDVFEGEYDFNIRKHPGVVRLLNYENHANAGTYSQAIRQAELSGGPPQVTATRRNGTLKYGFGLNAEQEITKNIGVFGRLGWNDGKTESFAFTAVDRLATAGVSVTGERWRRRFDTAASEVTVSGLSGVHALYLSLGGNDFLIGDGRLRYGPECIWESYYNARLVPWFFAGFDFQHVWDPAYNRDRGPVNVLALRFHIEFGKDAFTGHGQP